MERAEGCVLPKVSEVLTDGLSVAPDDGADENETKKRGVLGKRKYVLDDRAGFDTQDIDGGEQHDHGDGHQVLTIQANVHIAERQRTDPPKWNMSDMPNPFLRG